jgi:hypothetical protein
MSWHYGLPMPGGGAAATMLSTAAKLIKRTGLHSRSDQPQGMIMASMPPNQLKTHGLPPHDQQSCTSSSWERPTPWNRRAVGAVNPVKLAEFLSQVFYLETVCSFGQGNGHPVLHRKAWHLGKFAGVVSDQVGFLA